jgi:hypothetical protein
MPTAARGAYAQLAMRWCAIFWHVLFHTSERGHRCRAMTGGH